MSIERPRWETSRGWYITYLVLSVFLGLLILGGILTTIERFPQDYFRDKVSAFEVLAGALIGLSLEWFVLRFCFRRLKRIQKAREEQTADTKSKMSGTSPSFVQSTAPESDKLAVLNALKEELFTLETNNLSGKIAPEQYAEARAALETRLRKLSEVAVLDLSSSAPSEPEQEQASTVPKRTSLWITVPILAVLCWVAFLVFHRNGISAYAVGEVIGTLLIPFLIAYAVAGAKKRRNWVTFSIVFFAVGMLLPGATNQASLTSLSRSDMIRELVGSKPLEDNLPENQREMASATKAFFGDIKAFRKSHDEQLAALEPELGQLYSAESFSGKEAMQRSLNAVDQQLSLDRETVEMLERIPELARTRINQTQLSVDEREKFITGVMKGFTDSDYLSVRRQAMVAESNWADSAHDLYGFAIQHVSQIVVTKDRIGIASNTIRGKFNERFTRSKALLDTFLAAGKKADELRAANMAHQGLTDADFGPDQ